MSDMMTTPTAPTAPAAPSAEGMSVAEARAARDELIKTDGAKHLNGDVETRARMRSLNEIISGNSTVNRVEAALNGAVASNGVEFTTESDFLTQSEVSSVVKELRNWYSDEIIRDIAAGGTVTTAKREEALRARERIMRDREFLRGYLQGERERVQLVKNINAVLAATVKD